MSPWGGWVRRGLNKTYRKTPTLLFFQGRQLLWNFLCKRFLCDETEFAYDERCRDEKSRASSQTVLLAPGRRDRKLQAGNLDCKITGNPIYVAYASQNVLEEGEGNAVGNQLSDVQREE